MKKRVSILAITVLMASMMSVTVFAHGGHGNGYRANPQPRHELCTIDGCEEIGPHQHGDTWYCSQSARSGNYEVCTVEGCTQLGLHEHNGEYFYCQNHGTGVGCGRRRMR